MQQIKFPDLLQVEFNNAETEIANHLILN